MNKCEWKDGSFIGCEKVEGPFPTPKDWEFCPYCGADIRKPVEIKVGMFGTYYDSDRDRGKWWGILEDINLDKKAKYYVDYEWYDHFTPGLPTDYNMDGTPKEEVAPIRYKCI